jgi:carbon-monoxide dehydrogenase small subunit
LKKIIRLKVNGEVHEIAVDPWRTLLEVLREDLGLTGTKESCDLGTCGACTVLINGEPMLSCLLLAWGLEDQEILTIEGMATGGRLHPLQEAFINHGAFQCGFCTPGMILTAKALLEENPHPSEEEVRKAISGNICRCTGYTKIIDAISAAALAASKK